MRGERLTREDGIRLFQCHDLAWLGALADHVRREKCGDIVYYNVNCHVNLTNICTSHCKFCAFGRDADEKGAYAMTKAQAIAVVEDAMRDPNLAGLHVVSGLHPTWSFENYLGIVEALHERFPKLYMKGFTGVEITHFAERDDGIIDIEATIYCEKASHKAIIIGKHGAMLKKIATDARKDCEKFMGAKVYLQLWVKVKENWRDSDFLIRNFGYQ